MTAVLAPLVLAGVAAADTVTLVGSSIPLRGCEIQAIRGGRVHFLDAGGRRQRRALEEIGALGFDNLPTLDVAEAAFRGGDLEKALVAFLIVNAKAEAELPKLWTHVRLAQVHDLRGEFVQAAGHAAAVFALTDDPAWRLLAPRSEPNEPSFEAAHETITRLDQAARAVINRQLQEVIVTLRARVAPIHELLAAGHDGPVPEPGATISGIPLARILQMSVSDAMPADASARPPAPTAVPETASPAPLELPQQATPRGSTPQSDAGAAGLTARAIDRLLDEQRWLEAVEACRQVEGDPGSRDLAHYLYQYGRGLRGVGRPREAAVMWTRAAIHFGGTEPGQESLLEVARLYLEELDQPATSIRLLDRVIAGARAADRADLVTRAESLRRAAATHAGAVGDGEATRK